MFAHAPAPVPTLHQTDLFRPHADPDDHWDLACVYALAVEGRLDLKGILIDYPPPALPESAPDIEAVAQLSRLTGVVAPVAVGSSRPMRAAADRQDDAPASEQGGAAFVVRTLREATAPVVIHIVGSCRDIALAANREPALFRDKCAAIYLNAGTGWPDPDAVPEHEYNVQLNAAAYSAIFDVDCPIYWMPCFETVIGERVVREYATWYDFRQDEILSRAAAVFRLHAQSRDGHIVAPGPDGGGHARHFRGAWPRVPQYVVHRGVPALRRFIGDAGRGDCPPRRGRG